MNELTYVQPTHGADMIAVLSQMRHSRDLCDITINVGEKQVHAHRAVLAASSAYFNAMFTIDLIESKLDVIEIKEVDTDAFIQLIDFMYTGQITINKESVLHLIPTSNLLQVLQVKDACTKYLHDQLDPLNCIGIRFFADLHNCQTLFSQTTLYIEQHFADVSKYEEFLSLDCESVITLISSDRLTVSSEELVFESVMAWIKHDLDDRKKYLPEVIAGVRLALLPQQYLIERVEEETLIKDEPLCKDYLIEAMKYHLIRPEKKTSYNSPRYKPRTPIGLPKMMMVIGGQAPKAIRAVESFDFNGNWSTIEDMKTRRCRCGVVVIGQMVYTIGGFNGSLRVKSVEIYDTIMKKWTETASMMARRSTLGAAVLNNCVYAVGGFDGNTGLNTVECLNLDPAQNETEGSLSVPALEWRYVTPMTTRRSSLGVAVLDGFMYVIGGYDGTSRNCLNSVERYNVLTDSWTLVSNMCYRRSGPGVCLLNGQLYAIGGHDGPMVRKSAERYDSVTDKWTSIADMNFCRRNAGVVQHYGLIYVIGGDDGSSNLNTVEYYDPLKDEWFLLSSEMTIGRSYAGVCIVDKV